MAYFQYFLKEVLFIFSGILKCLKDGFTVITSCLGTARGLEDQEGVIG